MPVYVAPEFTFENGETIYEAPVRYRTWGKLNACGDNAIIVCHALTGNPDVDEWWGELLGPGKALDTDRFFVISANVLGSPYGSASPISINPKTGLPYRADFPQATIRDTVTIHKMLLDHLGVKQLALAFGGSMGGMQVLEWGFYDGFARALAPVGVGGRHAAWAIAWGEAQRQAIFVDQNWKGGYYEEGHEPNAGLAAARMMAMISYRSMPANREKFARQTMTDEQGNSVFAIESYLRYQGDKLVNRFDANCYVHLTRQMDTHDISRGRGDYPDVLQQLKQPTLVVGIPSDVLYPLNEQEELAGAIPNATLKLLDSIDGHDAFLIEVQELNNILATWMDKHVQTTAFNPTDKTSVALC